MFARCFVFTPLDINYKKPRYYYAITDLHGTHNTKSVSVHHKDNDPHYYYYKSTLYYLYCYRLATIICKCSC